MNQMNKTIQQMITIIECICCVPISIYWIYIEYNNKLLNKNSYLNSRNLINSTNSEEIDEYI